MRVYFGSHLDMSKEGVELADRLAWVVNETGLSQRAFSREAFVDPDDSEAEIASASTKLGATLADLRQGNKSRVRSDFLPRVADVAAKHGVPVRLAWLSLGTGDRLERRATERAVEYDDPYPNRVIAIRMSRDRADAGTLDVVRSLRNKEGDLTVEGWLETIAEYQRMLESKLPRRLPTAAATPVAIDVSRQALEERRARLKVRKR